MLNKIIKEKSNFILSTGGGTPCFNNNFKVISKNGISIFIDPPKSLLVERIKNSTNRPLFQNKNNIKKKVDELYELRKRIRHSAAHVMADVTTKMFPKAKLAIGPPTDDGFYYDFLTDTPFTDQDIEKIENEMRSVIKNDLEFKYAEYTKEEALELNSTEPLKREIIETI